MDSTSDNAQITDRSLSWRNRQAILTRHPWITFVLPLAVYMVVGALEPVPAAGGTRSWFFLPLVCFPAVCTLKIVLTAAAVWYVLPGYRQFPFRVSLGALVTGAVGVGMWIALCGLGWERKCFGMLGLGTFVDFVVRSSYNPFAALQGCSPVFIWSFVMLRLAGMTLLVPPIEEFFLRGFLMRLFVQAEWWKAPIGTMNAAALLLSVIYPVLSHPGVEWLAAVAWFMLVTLLMFKTRSIWDCVVAHGVTNLLLGIYVVYYDQWPLM